jgi:oligopeptide transport system ATP-binding protein
MSTLLDVQDLEVCFHIPEGTVHAVNGISFKLEEGETLAIVGESGCGKTVSMLSLLSLIPLPPGEILDGSAHYLGSDLLKMPEEKLEEIRGKEISMIFQDPMTSLNPVLTIHRQVTEALRVHMMMSQEDTEARAIQLLEMVGIPDAAQRLREYPHQFSGGMRQRAMIAMALSCTPKILIADEPTTALDVTIQAQIVELVIRMRDQLGTAVIWITHDLGVVAELADRVVVMYAGFLVEEADVHSLYQSPQHPYTMALLSALPRADRRREHRLKSIPGAPPSLLIEPRGCPFARRCDYVFDRCWDENPPLTPCGSQHRIACWVDIHTGKPK